MAERRMFAKTIIDSDAFLDMTLTTQALLIDGNQIENLVCLLKALMQKY